ncbi:MAG: class F sortase [Candidatus Saccharimonadales bacterium]
MSDKPRIHLDDPAFQGRLKTYQPRPVEFKARPRPVPKQTLKDTLLVQKPKVWMDPEPEQVVAEKARPIVRMVEAPAIKPVAVPKPAFQTQFAASDEHPAKLKSFSSLKSRLLPGMAILLFLVGVGVSAMIFRTNSQVAPRVQALASQNSDAPDESEPDQASVGSYSVAPDLPRVVRVGKINLASRIKRVGVDAKNQLKAPGNVYDVGWYENSNKPGDAGGAVLLDAHVSGPTKPGAFKNINKLVAGDTIEIERGDGKKFNYKVVKTQVYEKDAVDMASALVSVEAGKAGLNLMTCAGSIKGNDYQQRLIVYAVQI